VPAFSLVLFNAIGLLDVWFPTLQQLPAHNSIGKMSFASEQAQDSRP
jgi:hypothetical protein